jgi:excinuclease ABC subunit C
MYEEDITPDNLKSSIQSLPDKPGVYQFLDDKSKIIYIGKAKSLKKRVTSYFNKINFENNKLRVLVKNIKSIQHIVVSSESDALLLENNLIKKYQPRYNINLKDDKTFPWIVIKNEAFPRVFSTRTIIKDASEYYGPYTSAATVRTLLSLVRELYKLRTCNLNLSEENINRKKFKVCLEYHLGNCKGPCEGLQTRDDYEDTINQIRNILKGNLRDVIAYLREMMRNFALEYRYEEADLIKSKIESLEKFQLKSTIVNPAISDVDVFSYSEDDKNAYVNFLRVINGAIIQAHSVEIQKKLDEGKEEILEIAVLQIRERLFSTSKEIILPFKLPNLPENLRVLIPLKGDKRKLLELSERNAKYFMLDRKRQKANAAPLRSRERILNTLKADLRLERLPIHIECFDNSNIQGSNPVAACVVFKNTQPSKKDYRHYNIKSVKGPDDYASMAEVVYRRYDRMIREEEDLPQLIIVDGGKGQLSAAVKALEALNLRGKIAIIGIAKRPEEIYFPDDPIPLYIDKNSESLKIIQHLRNEAHRFGINFHRLKRSGTMIKSKLEEIPGIGNQTIQTLISYFGSVDILKEKTETEIAEVIGKSKAKIITNYFSGKTGTV